MDEDKNDYHTKAINEAKEREAFYQQIAQELRTEERYRNYFSQFSPKSVDRFINYYATQKVNWYQYSNTMASWEKRKSEQWYEIARSFIVAIQRIKVFYTIVRWANYEISIPGMRSYHDFEKWLCNPFICPYIEPVQEYEIETAAGFIGSLSNERLKYVELRHISIHYLLDLGEQPEDEPDEYAYSLFARYWDKEYGTEYLKAKVPERVQKEYDYVWAYRDHLKQQEPAKEPVAAADKKPSLSYWEKEVTEKFIAACETAEYKRQYKTHRWWKNRNSFSELAERELDDLSDSPNNLPIESDDDWREALARTAEQYARQQVLQCLPLAYQEYKERRERGGSFADWVTDMRDLTTSPWYEKHLNDLLEGRKLMNEPADFNF